jgi:hypothetical protein
MSSIPVLPELFVIKAVSPEPQKPENENYIVLTKLNNGNWTTTPVGLKGIFAVRWFLTDNCVETKRVAFAVEELCKRRQTTVTVAPHKSEKAAVSGGWIA